MPVDETMKLVFIILNAIKTLMSLLRVSDEAGVVGVLYDSECQGYPWKHWQLHDEVSRSG